MAARRRHSHRAAPACLPPRFAWEGTIHPLEGTRRVLEGTNRSLEEMPRALEGTQRSLEDTPRAPEETSTPSRGTHAPFSRLQRARGREGYKSLNHSTTRF